MNEPTVYILDKNKEYKPVSLRDYPLFAKADRLMSVLSKHDSMCKAIDKDMLMEQTMEKRRQALHYETEQLPLHLLINILEAFGMIKNAEVPDSDQMIQRMMKTVCYYQSREYEPMMTEGYYVTIQGIMMFMAYRKETIIIEDPEEFVDLVTMVGKPLALSEVPTRI